LSDALSCVEFHRPDAVYAAIIIMPSPIRATSTNARIALDT